MGDISHYRILSLGVLYFASDPEGIGSVYGGGLPSFPLSRILNLQNNVTVFTYQRTQDSYLGEMILWFRHLDVPHIYCVLLVAVKASLSYSVDFTHIHINNLIIMIVSQLVQGPA